MDDADGAASRQMEPHGESNFHMRRAISQGSLPSMARVFPLSSFDPVSNIRGRDVCHYKISPAKMLVITKYLLQFVSSEEDSSGRFRRPTKASPDRKSKPHLASAPPIVFAPHSPFIFFLFLSTSLLPSFRMTWRPWTDGPTDRRADDRERELAISRASTASQPTFLHARHKGRH